MTHSNISGTLGPWITRQPAPHCPYCGRCPCCGQPVGVAPLPYPYYPWEIRPYPYEGTAFPTYPTWQVDPVVTYQT